MAEQRLELTVDALTGDLLVAHDLGPAEAAALGLAGGQTLGCARPIVALPPPVQRPGPDDVPIRVADPCLWHHSLVDGPGRRSVAAVQGCPIRCEHCWADHTHDERGGQVTTVTALAEALLDPAYVRDGVTIVGGEPLGQPEAVLALITALRAGGCGNIGLYSGYTLAALRRQAAARPAIAEVLATIDWLVDGRFVAALADHAPAWRGSRNQRLWRQRGGGCFEEVVAPPDGWPD